MPYERIVTKYLYLVLVASQISGCEGKESRGVTNWCKLESGGVMMLKGQAESKIGRLLIESLNWLVFEPINLSFDVLYCQIDGF